MGACGLRRINKRGTGALNREKVTSPAQTVLPSITSQELNLSTQVLGKQRAFPFFCSCFSSGGLSAVQQQLVLEITQVPRRSSAEARTNISGQSSAKPGTSPQHLVATNIRAPTKNLPKHHKTPYQLLIETDISTPSFCCPHMIIATDNCLTPHSK